MTPRPSSTEVVPKPAPPRSARRRLILRVGIAYVAAWLVGIGYGAMIRQSASWNGGALWERSLLRWFHTQQLPAWLDAVVLQIPLTGTNLTILPGVFIAGWWLWKRARQPLVAAQLLVVCIGSLSLNPTMKYLLGRDRPDLFPRRGMYNWASYPSGHAILTIALYFTIALLLYRARGWRWPFVVAAVVFLANAYSRLYLAVHWPTDLIGGLLIGLVWLAGTWRAFSLYASDALGEQERATAPSALAVARS
ncbi:MAG: Phosphoesterase, PA-phosphatase related protein [Gemmatimonadetes bacterium]|nr:Phosphoesterase, PA-phosphatase related protein [Gemmatimonadota bacterium]